MELNTRPFYHYDGDRLVGEEDMTGTVREYLYAGGEAPTAMWARQSDGSYSQFFFQTNTHGEVVAVTDRDGTIVNRYAYGPWGEATRVSEQVHQPFRYAGYRYEDGFDLYYLRARWYDSGTGRFLSRDSVRGNPKNLLSLNRYAYSECNPTSMIDPSGRSPRCSGGDNVLRDAHGRNMMRNFHGLAAAARNAFPDVPIEVILGVIYQEGGQSAWPWGGEQAYEGRWPFDWWEPRDEANVGPMAVSRHMARQVSMSGDNLRDPAYNIIVGTAYLSHRYKQLGGLGRLAGANSDAAWSMVYFNYVNWKKDPPEADWSKATGPLSTNDLFRNFCARLPSIRSGDW